MKSPEEILNLHLKNFLKENPESIVNKSLVEQILKISEDNSLVDAETFQRRNKQINSVIKEFANKNADI